MEFSVNFWISYIFLLIIALKEVSLGAGVQRCNQTFDLDIVDCCLTLRKGNNLMYEEEGDDYPMECFMELELYTEYRNKNGTTLDQDFAAIECVAECLFKHGHELDPQGNLDRNIFLKEFEDNVPKHWMSQIVSSVDSCVDTATRLAKKSLCTSGSLQFMSCFIRESFLNCPADAWVNSHQCNKVKEYLNTCPYNFPLLEIFGLHLEFDGSCVRVES